MSVDTVAKTYKYNFEYYLMKHLSHFVKPGAKRLQTTGEFNDALVFINPDKSIIVVVHNDSEREKDLTIKIGKNLIQPKLKPHSFNSISINQQ